MSEFLKFVMKRPVNALDAAREARKDRLRETNQGLRVLAQRMDELMAELEEPLEPEPSKPKMPTPKEIAKFLPPVPEMRPTVYGYCPRCSVTVGVSVREGCCTVCGGPLRGL